MAKAQVIILAGGQGSRLRPYTTVLPKPLMPVGELPILEIIIRQLKACGLTRIVISTGYLAGLIEAYFADGKRWGVDIRFMREEKPLGTAGAVKLVRDVEDDCLVMNGDILTDLDFRALLKAHKSNKAAATLTVKERVVKTDFGVIEVGPDGSLADYVEKPEHRSFVSTGIYMLNKRCRDFIGRDQHIGMPDLLLNMKAAGAKVHCFETKAMWFDLGRLDDFESAQEVFVKNQKKFLKS
jgi:NDP-mannose synthase